MTSKNVQGFTLIEVMITVAIIGILAAIAVPFYDQYITKTRRADAKIALSGLAQAQETFYTDRRTYALNLGISTAADTIRCLGSFCKIEDSQALSPDGYYELSIASRTGDDADIATGFILTATITGVQAGDTDCKTFTLDSLGNKGAKDANGSSNDDCW